MQKIHNIQALQAISALLVLVFHLMAGTSIQFLPGQAGVDIFFTISGFIIASIISREDAEPRKFLLYRLTRIVPFYWAVTGVALAIGWALPEIFPRMIKTPGVIMCSLLFFPCRVSPEFDTPIVLQGWTLNFEIGFYLYAALALLLPVRKRRSALLVFLVAAALISRLAGIFNPLFSPLMAQFALGVWLSMRQEAIARHRSIAASAVFGLAGTVLLLGEWVWPVANYWVRLDLHTALGGLVVMAALLGERPEPSRLVKSLSVLGDASYALYLTHLLIVIVAGSWLWWMGFGPRFAVLMLAAVGFSLAIHRFVERPLHGWSNRFLRQILNRKPSASV